VGREGAEEGVEDGRLIEWNSVRATYLVTGRQTLHESLLERLRQMIQDGELAPGARLSEQALCERFGVSRTPLREALKILAADGYLDWRANRGILVAEIQADEVVAAFELLGGLERLVGEMASQRMTPDDMQGLEVMHADMVRRHFQSDRVGYFRLNQAIHAELARLTRNPVIEDVYRSVQRRVYRARALSNTERLRWDASVQEHERIMAALRAREPARLAAELVAHSKATEAVILRELARLELNELSPPGPLSLKN
jgi:DNA-binding GntR family transcriptional regulator